MDGLYREYPMKMDDDWGYPHGLDPPTFHSTSTDHIPTAISPAFFDFQETHGTELWFQKFREALQAPGQVWGQGGPASMRGGS